MSAKILVVDDDHDIRTCIRDLLSDSYIVTEAGNGYEALEFLKTNHFDLVLLDVMMPGMNGYDVAKQIIKENNRIAIIFITGKDTITDIMQAMSSGGSDYIRKPFKANDLLRRVTLQLKK